MRDRTAASQKQSFVTPGVDPGADCRLTCISQTTLPCRAHNSQIIDLGNKVTNIWLDKIEKFFNVLMICSTRVVRFVMFFVFFTSALVIWIWSRFPGRMYNLRTHNPCITILANIESLLCLYGIIGFAFMKKSFIYMYSVCPCW